MKGLWQVVVLALLSVGVWLSAWLAGQAAMLNRKTMKDAMVAQAVLEEKLDLARQDHMLEAEIVRLLDPARLDFRAEVLRLTRIAER